MFPESISAVVQHGSPLLVNLVLTSLSILIFSYCIKLSIDNLTSKKVRKFGYSIRSKINQTIKLLNRQLELPNQTKQKPSWFFAAMMSWFSACSFLYFVLLVSLGGALFSKLTILQILSLSFYCIILVIAARYFYAEAHRERIKIINREQS